MSYAPYNSGPVGGGPMRTDIDFGAFGRAWEIAKSNIGVVMAAGLIALLPSFIISGIFQVLTPRPAPGASPEEMMAMMGPMYGMMGLQQLLGSMAQGVSSVALASFALGAYRKGTPEINDVIEGFKKIGPAILAGLLVQIVTMLGLLACCVGVFVVYALVMFTYPEIADGTTNPVEAIMASFERLKDKIFPAIAFSIVMGLVAAAGLLACGIGVLFTAPLATMALCIVYCDLTGRGPGMDNMDPAASPYSPYPRGQEMPSPYPPQDPPAPPAP